MPIRSINLKMILDRSEGGQGLRESLWLTHQVVNEAVAEIERVLLLCRGRAYSYGEDEVMSAAQVQEQTLTFAREIQKGNAKSDAGSDSDVLEALGGLYEALVPSVLLDDKGNPLDGNAQAAGGFASPLMDATSEGFQGIFSEILDRLPSWVENMVRETAGWEQESTDWLKTTESQQLQNAAHRPSRWVKRLRASEPWQGAFVEDQEKKRKEVQGVPTLIRRLRRDLGLLPIMRPPVTSRFEDQREGLTPWDRLAIRLAVAHLLSWESWNHRAASEHHRVQQQVDRQREQTERFGEAINRLREYESARHDQLARVALASDSSPFHVGRRAVRAWERVREEWLKPRGDSRNSRLQILAELQTKLGGKFGDPDLFRWMAEEGRECLWRDMDPLPVLARLNALEGLLQRKRERALYTPPDPQLHPRWPSYEPAGGSNLKKYDIVIDKSAVLVTLPLLTQGNGGLREKTFNIPLAPSGQIETPAWNGKPGKQRRLLFRSAHQPFSAALGGSEILLDRRHLENRQPEELTEGDVGSVWFKLVLNVDSKAPPDWLDGRGRIQTPPTMHRFNTGFVTRSRHADSLEPGFRVLSVDLGVRTFASCSVFELVQGRPAKGMAFLADANRDLWAQHERSFILTLPGETPNAAAWAARRDAGQQLGRIRRDLNRLKDLLRLEIKESVDERMDALNDFRKSLAEGESLGDTAIVPNSALQTLENTAALSQPVWAAEIARVHREIEAALGERVSSWRKRTRPRAVDGCDRNNRRGYDAGKSVWSVEHLSNVRRLLQGWSRHGRRFAQINRADRRRQGVFAARLLQHINALKNDRIKAGSDLIVQAARGFVPNANRGWNQKYEPCRLILLEDLARYRFRTDRPRRENSQLMRWNHRQILAELEMQADIYGMVVGTTGAGFTSQFHARSGGPGCRTRVLSADDLKSPGIQKRLELLASQGIESNCFQPGVRVPWEGGEEFVTLEANGRFLTVHADVNAAQNLQRRFWTRHGDAYRISAVEARQGEQSYWYPESEGVLLRGALGTIIGGNGYARLRPSADGDGFVLEGVTSQQWRLATGARRVSGDETGLDELDAELAEVAGDEVFERGEGRKVFFRDPSGAVLRSDRWYEGKEFWGKVQRRVVDALGLRAANVV